MKTENKTYTIGDISEVCNVSVKTLRYYDDIGLLKPSRRDSETNYRYYSKEQMLKLFTIRKLKSYGFSLEEIKRIIDSSSVRTTSEYLSIKSKDLKKRIKDLKILDYELESTLERLEKGATILECFGDETELHPEVQEIVIEEIPKFNCLFTRRTETDYNNASVSVARWFEMYDLAKKYKLKVIGVVISTYHNNALDQFLKKDCDLEVCIPVYGSVDTPDFKTSGGYRAVTSLHVGSHGTIINTHIRLIKWINENKHTIAGPVSEEYLISPVDVTNENDLLTKVIIPIEG